MASGDTKTQNYLDVAAHGARRDLPSDNCCNTRTQNLIVDVAKRIMDVEDEVERLKNNPDVADIVETYADLQSYDTSTLTDKDVIRVLADETHGGASTYYRYSTSTQTFTYIGKSSEPVQLLTSDDTNYNISGDPEDYIALWLLPSGTYSLDPSSGLTVLACVEDNGGTIEPLDAYTDAILITVNNDEVDESSYTAEYTVYTPVGGQYFAVDQDGMMSDKVFPYSTFVGASNSTDGEVGLVPAPLIADVDKFLKADGSWAAAGGGGIKALTSADYNWPTTGTKTSVALWLLPNGLYTFDSSTSVTVSSGVTSINNGWAFVEESTPNSGAVNIYVSSGGYGSGSTVNFYQVSTPGGVQQSSNKFIKHTDLFYSVVSQSQVNIGTSAGASGTSAVAIGQSSSASAAEGVAIGLSAKAQVKAGAVAIGSGTKSNKEGSVALGATSDAEYKGSVALGYGAKTTAIGEVNVGTVTSSYGYNSTNYRVISGVHDPQAAHDAATKGYVDNNGPLVLYANFNDFDDQDTITFYEEDTLTTPVTVGTIHAAASSGRDIKIVGRANAENDASERINYCIYRIVYPKVCDDSTMDETGITMDAIDSYNLSSKVRYSFSTFDGPTSTTFTTERAVV